MLLRLATCNIAGRFPPVGGTCLNMMALLLFERAMLHATMWMEVPAWKARAMGSFPGGKTSIVACHLTAPVTGPFPPVICKLLPLRRSIWILILLQLLKLLQHGAYLRWQWSWHHYCGCCFAFPKEALLRGPPLVLDCIRHFGSWRIQMVSAVCFRELVRVKGFGGLRIPWSSQWHVHVVDSASPVLPSPPPLPLFQVLDPGVQHAGVQADGPEPLDPLRFPVKVMRFSRRGYLRSDMGS